VPVDAGPDEMAPENSATAKGRARAVGTDLVLILILRIKAGVLSELAAQSKSGLPGFKLSLLPGLSLN